MSPALARVARGETGFTTYDPAFREVLGESPVLRFVADDPHWVDRLVCPPGNSHEPDQGKAILEGAPGAREVAGRREAIRAALAEAGAGDIVLLAGKGHETWNVGPNGPDAEIDYTSTGGIGIYSTSASNDANVVVINTCGFIESAKQESIDTILSYAKAKDHGMVEKVYVTGCLSQRYGPELKAGIPQVDAWFGTPDWAGQSAESK
mgnify:CR=1 FL=1